MLFDRTRFLGQVPLRAAGKVYNGDVSWIGDQICLLLDSVGGTRSRSRTQAEFTRLYGSIQMVDWKEAQLVEYIRQFCPNNVGLFNQYRAEWMSEREFQKLSRRPPPKPFPPIASVDPRNPPTTMYPPPPPPPPPPPRPISRQPVPSFDRRYNPLLPAPGSVLTPTPTRPTSMTPSAPYGPTSSYQEGFPAECPPGQFPAYPGGPCRGAVATGGLPTLPGGFSSANVSTSSFSAPSAPSWGMYGARRPIPVMNVRRRG